MADLIIPDYTAAGTIDPTQDLFLMWQNSSNSYKSINRNTILGLSGNPVDTNSVQTLSNKVLNDTNTVTLKDTLFTLQDNSDTTKQAQFQLSGLTTATTRTYTLPDASSTLADISTVQTFTNKTLTSPTIAGGSISNSTVSVDSISEYTTNNGVTVDGLNIKDGKLNSNNSVVTASMTDGAVTPAKLVAGNGSGWAWSTYTPSWTNLTVGSGTNVGYYTIIGKTVFFRIYWVFGSGAAVGSTPVFSLPVTASSAIANFTPLSGNVEYEHSAAGTNGVIRLASTTTALLLVLGASGTYVQPFALSSTVPFTWGTGDFIVATGYYEAA